MRLGSPSVGAVEKRHNIIMRISSGNPLFTDEIFKAVYHLTELPASAPHTPHAATPLFPAAGR